MWCQILRILIPVKLWLLQQSKMRQLYFTQIKPTQFAITHNLFFVSLIQDSKSICHYAMKIA